MLDEKFHLTESEAIAFYVAKKYQKLELVGLDKPEDVVYFTQLKFIYLFIFKKKTIIQNKYLVFINENNYNN